MANYSNTSRPAYVWDGVNNQWVPIGVGPHTHSVADMTNAVSNLGGSNIVNTTATSVPLTLTGAVSQTADLLDVKNSAGTVVANIDASGNFSAANYFVAGKNKIINGDFGVWQRGTSTTVTNGFCADRWVVAVDGTGGITTTQQSFTPGNTIAGYEPSFYLQSAVTSVGTSTTYFLSQRIEDVRTFAGQTVTLSFWAKADSVRSNVIYFRQVFGTGGSADNYTTFPAVTYSTSWQRYSFTLAIPSVSGKTIGTGSYLEPNIRSTVTSGMNIQIWGVQVEAGSVATPFTTASGTFQGELALCQRYYENNYPAGYAPGSDVHSVIDTGQTLWCAVATGGTAGSNRARGFAWPYKVTKRATPTSRSWDLLGNLTKYTAGDANGSQLTSNNSFDTYGSVQTNSITSITFQTVTASSSHIYAMVMWEVSAEL